MNQCFLVGRLGRDAELRYTHSGAAVCAFSLATSESWKDKSTGEKKEKTHWHQISYWGKGGEAVAKYLLKGKQVAVSGSIEYRKYEKDGVTRTATDIKANRVELLGGRGDSRDADDGGHEEGSQERQPRRAAEELTEDDIPFAWLLPLLTVGSLVGVL